MSMAGCLHEPVPGVDGAALLGGAGMALFPGCKNRDLIAKVSGFEGVVFSVLRLLSSSCGFYLIYDRAAF